MVFVSVVLTIITTSVSVNLGTLGLEPAAQVKRERLTCMFLKISKSFCCNLEQPLTFIVLPQRSTPAHLILATSMLFVSVVLITTSAFVNLDSLVQEPVAQVREKQTFMFCYDFNNFFGSAAKGRGKRGARGTRGQAAERRRRRNFFCRQLGISSMVGHIFDIIPPNAHTLINDKYSENSDLFWL